MVRENSRVNRGVAKKNLSILDTYNIIKKVIAFVLGTKV